MTICHDTGRHYTVQLVGNDIHTEMSFKPEVCGGAVVARHTHSQEFYTTWVPWH